VRRTVAVESVSLPVSSVMSGTFQELPITDIHEFELLTNPRATFDQDALNELAASIRLHGVLQTILVRPRSNDSGYELIAGARRLRASRLAEIAMIPAHVVTFDDQAAREAAIIDPPGRRTSCPRPQGRDRLARRLCEQHHAQRDRHRHRRRRRARHPLLKGYTVFNLEQIDGLPAQYTAPASPRLDVSARIARAECFFGATGATVAHGGNRAFYRPSTDSIVLPLFETFRDAESYYATRAHETTHWTAHESRLARDFGTQRFGSEGYAIEELVAELGAAFVCADLDLTLGRVRTTPPTSPTGWTCSRQTIARSSSRPVTRSSRRTSSTACSRLP
jgi:zincin-like metallopeptidase/ParB-like nuclease family protein